MLAIVDGKNCLLTEEIWKRKVRNVKILVLGFLLNMFILPCSRMYNKLMWRVKNSKKQKCFIMHQSIPAVPIPPPPGLPPGISISLVNSPGWA